jgi:hypothetical protein
MTISFAEKEWKQLSEEVKQLRTIRNKRNNTCVETKQEKHT